MEKEYMKLAIIEAKKCKVDVPVGAVIVKDGKIIAKAHNKKEKRQDATCHAEIEVIKKASKKLKNFILESCDIYVTLEPCMMCYGAISSARIHHLYFGAYNEKFSCVKDCESLPFNHHVKAQGGILEEECRTLIQTFFKKVREDNGRSRNKNKIRKNRI